MIRIGLPPPMLPRVRLQWHAAHAQFLRQSRALREYASRTQAVTQARWERVVTLRRTRLSLSWRLAQRQRTRLHGFMEKYDDFVDLLCWAAKEGVQDWREARYIELRSWMRVHYRPLRRKLRAFCTEDGVPTPEDPFAILFAPETITEAINSVTSIEILMQTRAALEAFQDSLDRRLGAQ